MHRVFCSDIPPVGGYAELEARENEHLFKVFRAAPGEPVELLDGRGVRASGAIESGRKIRIASRETVPEPTEKLHLCCALPRRQKLDALLKQAAELGAWSIRPTRCVRSVVEGGPRERWDLLLREACKQSGNPFLPRVEEEEKLPAVLEQLRAEHTEIYYGAVAPAPRASGTVAGDRAILIGPEGGFTPEETALIEGAGAKPLNLGPYILRLETAAVCGLVALRLLKVWVPALFLLTAVLFVAGCGQSDVEKNPLMVKAAKLRSAGDVETARRFYRQAIAKYPEAPEPYLALARLCDEDLDDPLEALYGYRSYLQLAPKNDPNRSAAQAFEAVALSRVVKKSAAGRKFVERAELERKNLMLTRLLYRQQQQLTELKKKLDEAERKTQASGGRRYRR